MRVIEESIKIQRPQEDVFWYVSNSDFMASLAANIVAMERVRGNRGEAGELIRVTVQVGRRRIEMTSEVTVVDPPRRLVSEFSFRGKRTAISETVLYPAHEQPLAALSFESSPAARETIMRETGSTFVTMKLMPVSVSRVLWELQRPRASNGVSDTLKSLKAAAENPNDPAPAVVPRGSWAFGLFLGLAVCIGTWALLDLLLGR